MGPWRALLAVVDGVILRPLRYDEPGRLVAIGTVPETAGGADPETGLETLAPMTSEVFRLLRERARFFEQTATVTSSDHEGL